MDIHLARKIPGFDSVGDVSTEVVPGTDPLGAKRVKLIVMPKGELLAYIAGSPSEMRMLARKLVEACDKVETDSSFR